jgi:agmatinase
MARYKANLPCVGIPSFVRAPICEEFDQVDADVAFLGIPYDVGIGFRPGCRFGPREIRCYSTRYSAWGAMKSPGYWDINKDKRYLANVRIVDCGDVDIVYYDQEQNFHKITESVRTLLGRGCLPVLVGGDHSVTFPIVCAFEEFSPLGIVHFDAHLDWIDEVEGVRFANGSPLRRAAELPFVGHMTHLGIRCVRSREDDYRAAKARGNLIFTRDQIRRLGTQLVLDQIPSMKYIYVTIDADGLDPSIAPGTGSPTVDGLLYHELRELLQGVASKGKVVGFDFVEVNPQIDVAGQTSLLATTAILEFLGAIFDQPR